MSRRELFVRRLRATGEAIAAMLTDPVLLQAVEAAVDTGVDSIRAGGKVLLCGNGGSAADAQHLAAELVGRFLIDRPPYPALALADNVSALTAISNDYSYSDAFARGVQAFGTRNDVVIGLSTSGRSSNVLAALETARSLGIKTVAFVGPTDSPIGQAADVTLAVPAETTAGIQELHMMLGHVIFELIERELSLP